MSRIFKRPKSYPNQGSVLARNLKAAQLIKDQDELDKIILMQPDKSIAKAWLEVYTPCMKFVPQTWEEIQARLLPEPETVAE